MEILHRLPAPRLGEHVSFMGNTGEGKTMLATALLLDKNYPNYIIVNTKHDDFFKSFGKTITDDEEIFRVVEGGFNYCPSDVFLQSMPHKERFFAWCLRAGNRRIYCDEVNDICPSASRYPFMFQKAIKQGRWKKLSMFVTAQEIIRAPSFCFSQTQHRYLWYLGWPLHRKLAEAWFEQEIPWDLIPERSHKFLLKTPGGLYGPQPPVNTTVINERLANATSSAGSRT